MSDVEDYIDKYIKEERIRMFSSIFYISFKHFYPTSQLDEKTFISEFRKILKGKNLHRCLGNAFLQINIKTDVPLTTTVAVSIAVPTTPKPVTVEPTTAPAAVQKRKRSNSDDENDRNVKFKTDER